MNEKELKILLEKYYSSISTDEEEVLLREYFRNGTIPDGYETEKVIFGYFTDYDEIPEPSADFESQIIAGIDSSIRISPQRSIRKILVPYLSAAAGIIIMLGSYFFFIQKGEPRDTFSDPEIAYAETVKILMEVSEKLNRGTKALEPVGKLNEMREKSFIAISKSKILVEKNFRSFEYLQQAIDISAGTPKNEK